MLESINEYLTLDFSCEQYEKLFSTRSTVSGHAMYKLPLEYEQVDAIIESIYAYMKRTTTRKQEITLGRDNRQNVNQSLCRVYVDFDSKWNCVYWPHKNETQPHDDIPTTKKSIKELVLYAMKWSKDPAEN